MWGTRRRLGPEEQSPRDRSKGRMRHVTKYLLLETGASKRSPHERQRHAGARPGYRSSGLRLAAAVQGSQSK